MDSAKVKEQFLARFPKDITDKLPSTFKAILDEGIEHIQNGTALIDGRSPETSDEIFIALSTHFIAASQLLQGTIDGARKAFPNEALNINVNYRGETQTFEFDALNPLA